MLSCSRPNAAAASPRPPTSASEPGASSGGPITRLKSGSSKPPGLRATPRTCVTTPISAVEAVQRRQSRQPRPRGALGADSRHAGRGQRRRQRDRRPHPLVAERPLEVLEVDLEPERERAERGGGAASLQRAAGTFPPGRVRSVRSASHQATLGRIALRLRALELEPVPGAVEIGRSAPSTGSTTPSNSMCSIRTWSWKYSRWTKFSSASRRMQMDRRPAVQRQRHDRGATQRVRRAAAR